jgi:hypothetical protein
MLSQVETYFGHEVEAIQRAPGRWIASVDGRLILGTFPSAAEALQAARNFCPIGQKLTSEVNHGQN